MRYSSSIEQSQSEAVNHGGHLSAKRIMIIALCVVAMSTVIQVSKATGLISKGDLEGPWQATLLLANSGCGPMSILVNFTLNAAGSATNATLTSHSSCGTTTTTGQTFTVSSLATNGSGTAGLSCGAGCGWNFHIQVSPDRSIFNLVDVDVNNPGNYVEGVAIHQ
jgi:hypothetical protein